MSEDLLENLSTYNEQLKQVDAALTNSPSDPELLKLREDLLEVLHLTNDLINSQTPAALPSDDIASDRSLREWKTGDKCMAPWSKDLRHYPATVEEVSSDGQVMVQFDEYDISEVVKLEQLREPSADDISSEKHQPESSTKTNKRMNRNQEYLKKKKQKKMQRFKELADAREEEKNKWQQFSTKAKKGRGMRGVVKSSIFKTPDAVNGKVGIGTCGVGGKPMTSYAAADKWKRGV